MTRSVLILAALLFSGCSSRMTSWNEGQGQRDVALEELRLELSDLRHTLNGTKVDMQLLEDKIKNQPSSKKGGDSSQLAALEHKIAELQKNQEKLNQDLKQLSSHANQTSATFAKLEQEIQAQTKRLEEIVKLKGTLTSISQALKEKNRDESASYKTYKIKNGDSLEKIARQQGTTVDAIKRLNDLSSDRIVVGQEIKLPD